LLAGVDGQVRRARRRRRVERELVTGAVDGGALRRRRTGKAAGRRRRERPRCTRAGRSRRVELHLPPVVRHGHALGGRRAHDRAVGLTAVEDVRRRARGRGRVERDFLTFVVDERALRRARAGDGVRERTETAVNERDRPRPRQRRRADGCERDRADGDEGRAESDDEHGDQRRREVADAGTPR